MAEQEGRNAMSKDHTLVGELREIFSKVGFLSRLFVLFAGNFLKI